MFEINLIAFKTSILFHITSLESRRQIDFNLLNIDLYKK